MASAILSVPKNWPEIIYGTAWKKEATLDCVQRAISAGFRAFDTANQLKHYDEELLGAAWFSVGLKRPDIWLQTKFTPINGQDSSNYLPYSPTASLKDQVSSSIKISLKHLRTSYLDAILLHSDMGSQNNLTVWRVFEDFYQQGIIKNLGISNCHDLQTLKSLYSNANIKPMCIQNRFYQTSNYDTQLRKFCKEQNPPIRYQSFWTLTANPHLLHSPLLQKIATANGGTPEQALYHCCLALDIIPLTGTKNTLHMQQDLAVINWPKLDQIDLTAFQNLLLSH